MAFCPECGYRIKLGGYPRKGRPATHQQLPSLPEHGKKSPP